MVYLIKLDRYLYESASVYETYEKDIIMMAILSYSNEFFNIFFLCRGIRMYSNLSTLPDAINYK